MHRIEEIEKALNLLDTYDGQLSKTARALGINRYTLRSWRDKRKKVCTPLEVLSLYQTCRSNMVETMGFEPMIFWSQTRRDNQASLRLETALFCPS